MISLYYSNWKCGNKDDPLCLTERAILNIYIKQQGSRLNQGGFFSLQGKLESY